jgi:hypothetical protein
VSKYKTNIKNLDKVLNAVREALGEFTAAQYKEIGEYAKTRIVETARAGSTMKSGQTKEKLKPLSKNYIKYRKSIDVRGMSKREDKRYDRHIKKRESGKGSAFNESKDSRRLAKLRGKNIQTDSQFFSPARSNLTLTGQFLNSFTVATNKLKRLMTIYPSGYREGKGKRLSNKTLGRYLSEQGRSIFGIDLTGRKVIKQKVLEHIRRNLIKKRLQKK